MLIGEGVGAQVRATPRDMEAITVIVHVLVSQSENRRETYWARRDRPLADRLERVLSRHARQRLMSWYWATVLDHLVRLLSRYRLQQNSTPG